MQAAINLFGSNAIAAYTAAEKLEMLVEQGMVAMGQAVATYCGQNYGKGDVERIRAGVKAALGAIMAYGAIAAIVVSIVLEPTLRIFFSEGVDMASMMPWARTYMNICASFFLPLSMIFVFRNAMQGCSYGFLPMMGGVSELVARLVVAVIAMRIGSYALAVFCHPAAWVAAAAFTGVSYRWVIRDIVRKKGKL